MALICGLNWTRGVIEVLIDLLECIGKISNLTSTYLALTIIGLGNALPDAFITIALAKKG